MKKIFLLIMVGCLSYLGSTAQTPQDICAINIGEEVPNVTVKSSAGKKLELKEIIKEPTILIFYRGGWCPYCNTHLQEMQQVEDSIKAYGYKMVGLSSDKFDQIDKTAIKKGLSYDLYSDNKAEASNAFGIAFELTDKQRNSFVKKLLGFNKWSGKENKTLPVPSVFIIRDGVIQYRYVNPDYKTRLTAEMLMTVLRSLDN